MSNLSNFRICLIPLKIEIKKPSINLNNSRQRLEEAIKYKPDLVVLPECAMTGYLYEEEDLRKFSQKITGEIVNKMSFFASYYKFYLSFGFLELSDDGFYNSALLFDKKGNLLYHYRKINEQTPFLSGNNIKTINTEIGKLTILICGDLFDDNIKEKLDKDLDFIIVPMSRSFENSPSDLQLWINEERNAYINRVKEIGITTFIVNSLENLPLEGAFGGAMVISDKGELLAESKHGTDEILIYDYYKKI